MIVVHQITKGVPKYPGASSLHILNMENVLYQVDSNRRKRRFVFDDELGGDDGTQQPQDITESGSHNLDPDLNFYVVDCSDGPVTLNYPAPALRVGKGPLVVKRNDSQANGNTLTLVGTFDGATNFLITNNGGVMSARAVASGYLVTGSHNLNP